MYFKFKSTFIFKSNRKTRIRGSSCLLDGLRINCWYVVIKLTVSMQLGKLYDKYHLHRTSKLSFTTDVWTTQFRFFPYTGITVHWIDRNWEQQESGLALSPIDGPHTGENLSEAFIENVDHRFRIFHKVVHRIFTITINFP